jgi:hypothetical protein
MIAAPFHPATGRPVQGPLQARAVRDRMANGARGCPVLLALLSAKVRGANAIPAGPRFEGARCFGQALPVAGDMHARGGFPIATAASARPVGLVPPGLGPWAEGWQ